jgi:uncharacterized surface protein with fasciclin (FAS1) repeats
MDTRDNDIVENAAKAGHFNWLGDALKAAGLIGTYKGDGPFTFFAPTDEAFEKIPPGALRRLLEDKAKLAAILNFHVMPGALLMKDLQAQDSQSCQVERSPSRPTRRASRSTARSWAGTRSKPAMA